MESYEGMFEDGRCVALARTTTRTATSTRARKNSKMHGQGRYSGTEGVYEGQFEKDEKCGFGKLTSATRLSMWASGARTLQMGREN